MARRERPLQPADGPLQAFAHDLRELRARAGHPPYRSLAKRAHYSASTLSEAAAGRRRPTLEVVLAYAEACGGDSTEWKRRWLALEGRPVEGAAGAEVDQLVPTTREPLATDPSAKTRTAEQVARGENNAVDTDSSGTGENLKEVTPHMWRRRRLFLRVGALAAAAAVVAGSVMLAAGDPAVTPSADKAACPDVPNVATLVLASDAGAAIRSGPSRSQPIKRKVPPRCPIGIIGYCLGEQVRDVTSRTPDIRWYRVAGGGVVASAVVHGNSPATWNRSQCGLDRPPPSSIAISAMPDRKRPGNLLIRTSGKHVDIVGLAAYYSDDTSAGVKAWHQIVLTDSVATTTQGISWSPARRASGPAATGIPVAAVACLGGDAPTSVMQMRLIRLNDPHPPSPAPLTFQDREAIGRSACRYP